MRYRRGKSSLALFHQLIVFRNQNMSDSIVVPTESYIIPLSIDPPIDLIFHLFFFLLFLLAAFDCYSVIQGSRCECSTMEIRSRQYCKPSGTVHSTSTQRKSESACSPNLARSTNQVWMNFIGERTKHRTFLGLLLLRTKWTKDKFCSYGKVWWGM